MIQPHPHKPSLLVLLHHDYAARDFLQSGVLDHLAKSFQLSFVVTDGLKADLSALGQVVGWHRMSYFRMRVWEIAFGLRHLDGLDPIVKSQPNRHEMFQRGTPGPIKTLVLFFHAVGLARLIIWLLKHVLVMTRPTFIHMPVPPAVALLPSGIKDPTWDDVSGYCRHAQIPALTVTINWDNIAHKLFLYRPDRLGVWGEQGYLFARLLQQIPAEQIVTIGTPRFEHYRGGPFSKSESKRKMGLPENGRVILFAGSGVTFDEVSLIDEFEQAMTASKLPTDLFMLYKPHPKRHQRTGEPPLRPEGYRYVRVIKEEGLTRLEDYPALLAASDGLVTPMSTMLLEGAIMGLPALGLVYDDPAHGDYSWANARDNNHLHPIINSRWHLLCAHRTDFLTGLKSLAGLMGKADIGTSAQNTAKFILHDDGRPYAICLQEALMALLGRVPL